ncbi:hypothetical protein YC2023_104857 [Brassica napus]
MEQPHLPPPSQTAESRIKEDLQVETLKQTQPRDVYLTSSMQHIPQRIHQLQEGISIRPIIVCIRNVWDIKKHQTDSTRTSIGFMCYDHNGQLLEGRVTGDIQPNDSKNLTEGDSYEFSRFYVIHNSRQRKLTQLPYYIQIGQRTTALNVTLDGPMFPVHSLSPQRYTNLLRLASTPTYLPGKSTIVKLILCDQQAADFSILQSKKNRKFKVMIITSVIPKLIQGKLILHSSPATVFYFNKSIDYIKHFKRRIRDYAKTCSTE